MGSYEGLLIVAGRVASDMAATGPHIRGHLNPPQRGCPYLPIVLIVSCKTMILFHFMQAPKILAAQVCKSSLASQLACIV